LYCFLIPLLLGFACNLASTFTTAFTRRWGEMRGRALTYTLRNFLGIPLWVIGLGLAVRLPAPLLFTPTAVTGVLAWLIIAGGAVLIWAALLALGWRAAAPTTDDALESRGIYSRIRHPIYSGLLLEFAGILLLNPTPPVLLAITLGVAWVLIQARLEEIDLLQRMPAYQQYMQRVPRFLPRLR